MLTNYEHCIYTHDLLETMEESENKIYNAPIARNPQTESVGICEHKERLLENFQQPNNVQNP